MKAFFSLVLSTLLVLASHSVCLSDEGSEPEEKEPAPVPEAVADFQKNLGKIDLSKEQKTSLDELVTEVSESFANASGGEEKEQLVKDFRYQVTEYVLNQKQREKLGFTQEEEKPATPKPVAAMLEKLKKVDLDEKQQKHLDRLVAEVSADFADEEKEVDKKATLQSFRYNVVEYVLTDEQRDQLGLKPPKQKPQGTHIVAMIKKRLKGVELSEEQQAKLNEIAEEAADMYDRAEGEEAKQKVVDQVRYRVREYLLTEKQREKLKSAKKSETDRAPEKPKKEAASKDSDE